MKVTAAPAFYIRSFSEVPFCNAAKAGILLFFLQVIFDVLFAGIKNLILQSYPASFPYGSPDFLMRGGPVRSEEEI